MGQAHGYPGRSPACPGFGPGLPAVRAGEPPLLPIWLARGAGLGHGRHRPHWPGGPRAALRRPAARHAGAWPHAIRRPAAALRLARSASARVGQRHPAAPGLGTAVAGRARARAGRAGDGVAVRHDRPDAPRQRGDPGLGELAPLRLQPAVARQGGTREPAQLRDQRDGGAGVHLQGRDRRGGFGRGRGQA